jgi:choline dehydrogenase-like flavoprotein
VFIDVNQTDQPIAAYCDVCIVGGGVAGITLAYALIDSGMQVCLLESGGFEYEDDIQSLYGGESIGLQQAGPMQCRLRYFGGSSNRWTGWCAPLQEIDFAVRPWIPHSGWPIRQRDLDPYYEQAWEMCQIRPAGNSGEPTTDRARSDPEWNPETATLRTFQFSPPTRFGQVYREPLAKAQNITVFLHANVTHLETDATAFVVRAVQIRNLAGKTGRVCAHATILACGGLENARLLLLSNQTESAGLGNRSGLVGRYFMQHVEGTVARILVTHPEMLWQIFRRRGKDHTATQAELSLASAAQRRHSLLNTGFTITTHELQIFSAPSSPRDATSSVINTSDEGFTDQVRSVMQDLAPAAERDHTYRKYITDLYVRAEPLPNANSRLVLGRNLDRLGLPTITLDWQLTEFDKHSIAEAVQRIAEEFGRLHLGRFQVADWLLQQADHWPQPLWGGCHHMGTTRISDDPMHGVVDSQCRVHSVYQLYIAGSSVFATAGYVPPTLTIVALALRLAAHLKQQFSKGF